MQICTTHQEKNRRSISVRKTNKNVNQKFNIVQNRYKRGFEKGLSIQRELDFE